MFFIFFSFLVFAQQECPKNSLKVEFDSPLTGAKKILCQIKKDGKFETIMEINSDSSSPNAQKEVSKAPDIKKISMHLEELLKILSIEQQKSTTEFIVDECDKNQSEWVKMALTNTSRKVSYHFDKKCDVEGAFEAQFGKIFPMNMKLRHMSNYDETKMNVLLSIIPGSQGIELKFETGDSSLHSSQEIIKFKAWYSISINPLTGRPFPGTKKGEITILEVNDQKMNLKSTIHYE